MIMSIMGKSPKIGKDVFIADNASIIGDVRIANNANIWFNTTLRADINYIEIGEGVNIQDGTVIHLDKDIPVIIEKGTTVGHMAMIHAAHIEEFCLIGMGAIILDGARIGKNSIIAAGAVVTPGTIIPPNSMVMGTPAKVRRNVTKDEIAHFEVSMNNYIEYAKEFIKEQENQK